MNYQTLRYEEVDGIATITLNRPEQLNAFTVQMADDLVAAFGRASTDDEVRAVILTGEGRAFCAGMDLTVDGNVFGLDESLEPTVADLTERFDDPVIERGVRDTGGRVALAIYACDKPVIGAINGPAVGVGATMTLPLDVRLMSNRGRIGFVFGRIGIVPETCSTWFLPRIVGMAKAIELVLGANILDAEEAVAAGLVRSVHEPEALLPAARAVAMSFVRNRSPVAVALTRHMMYRLSALSDPLEAHRIESLGMFWTSIADGKEGVAAFRERRPAEFSSTTTKDMPPFFPW
jgi:enoyl-CoA hydratase/carnithine racemase